MKENLIDNLTNPRVVSLIVTVMIIITVLFLIKHPEKIIGEGLIVDESADKQRQLEAAQVGEFISYGPMSMPAYKITQGLREDGIICCRQSEIDEEICCRLPDIASKIYRVVKFDDPYYHEYEITFKLFSAKKK